VRQKIDGIVSVVINGVGYACVGASLLIGPVPRKKTRRRLRRERIRRNRERRIAGSMRKQIHNRLAHWQRNGFVVLNTVVRFTA
jgi:hypothetical protein